MIFKRLLPLTAIALLGLAGCSKSSDESANTSKLEVRLMDAPGDFRSVVLDVIQVEVHLKDENDPDGWKKLNFTPRAINVLEYVNGNSALLVNDDFAPGDLKEIRLILGPNSYVIGRDGQQYDLKTPSGQTSGVKLKLEKATLKLRETYQLLLDFDVAKSIVERGNWKPGNDKKERYLLKPVIRVVAQDLRAGLHGTVNPAAAQPQILAIRTSGLLAPDTVSTAADASGEFRISGLAAGTYRVEFFPTTTATSGQPNYQNKVLTGVTIVSDQVKELGTTSLN
ncbi:DUF4382 domain-containing protein [Microvirga sp. STS02]|uniref:DUF4382 domain-containing protein n=1 Tax=Hymenobacter negativus TaxID=2795026 RepID=UPI0018DC0B64|nr:MULTISPECIES: DUF4382 domain-containing protein [Bacteria]MBH8570380.1 DUF4382 domain-containing protein [Hymenobacter negativus]MBR7210119.1 DUF4382 domain-containing protein [Microvirga sp. STS02]